MPTNSATMTKSQSGSGKKVESKSNGASRASDIQGIFEAQKKKSIELRKSGPKERSAKLKKLRDQIVHKTHEIQKALFDDFKKSQYESDLTEIMVSIAECNDAMRHVHKWMKPLRVKTPMTLFGATSEVRYEPRGVCLIISPWNYPFYLAVAPLIAAIAAGNTIIVKPSEYSPATSRLLNEMLTEIFDEDEVAVIEGDAKVSQELTALPFDHIFFTGSTEVGKKIMEAASKHLTSVTLELGGKSPAILDESADMKLAAEKLMWGKVMNAGQTCVAPDYLLIPESKVESFVKYSKEILDDFYSSKGPDLKKNTDYCRIINGGHFNRIKGYLDEAVSKGAKIEVGGDTDEKENYIAPTIVTNVPLNSKLMQDEIFGPVLPVIPYKDIQEAIDLVNGRPKPLALYIFAQARKKINRILKSTSSGGSAVNEVIVHLANPHLPFGGVNHSGHGNYHGIFGFKAFSHERAILKQIKYSSIRMLYPPYGKFTEMMLRLTKKYLV